MNWSGNPSFLFPFIFLFFDSLDSLDIYSFTLYSLPFFHFIPMSHAPSLLFSSLLFLM